ncbi:hypothetical protein B0A50_04482 [Salinomyces thailandicus]|uniref:Uncharacterized protein n=1 Tax=Salinomyces thailandicus TaxID=706561 RepID=A0A4U0TZD2_9PEZI|nr:hypothetical protein B0A50_04482 [Salinomyces thailandica]
MAYRILASVCRHLIRTYDTLPWSGSTIPWSGSVCHPNIRYCPSCEASQSILLERDEAERDFETAQRTHSIQRTQESYENYRASMRRYDNARLAYAEDLEFQQDRADRERFAQGETTLALRTREGRPRQTRFAEPESHRSESEYRAQGEYRRRSKSYLPGAHADTSGQGFYNTSDPSTKQREDKEDKEDGEDMDWVSIEKPRALPAESSQVPQPRPTENNEVRPPRPAGHNEELQAYLDGLSMEQLEAFMRQELLAFLNQ